MRVKRIEGIANINGRIEPLSAASVPVLDHGFLYGDSVFETMRTIGGYPFQLSKHIDRLFHSAEGLSLKIPVTKKGLKDEVFRTLRAAARRAAARRAYYKKHPKSELYVRIVVTRGYGDIGFDPKLCPRPTLLVIVKKFRPLAQKFYEDGMNVAIVPVIRNHPQALDPNIKSGNYLNNVLAYIEAKKRGADDAILLNEEGFLTEASNSNLFLVKNGVVMTPSIESGVLKGLTRAFIIEVAKKHGMAVEERKIKKEELFQADECFLSSVLKRVLPVTRCNLKAIGSGSVGPVVKKLLKWFDKEAELATVRYNDTHNDTKIMKMERNCSHS
jgi:branched-chain amino acid aminotransferase